MNDPLDPWTKNLRDMTGKSRSDAGEDAEARFVRELYTAAQKDLDEQRSEADFRREE